MRFLCAWCAALALAAAQEDARYFAPQTFAQVAPQDGRRALFRPADAAPQATVAPSSWRSDAQRYDEYSRGGEERRPEPWRVPLGANKERQANILHHKQSLSSDGAFRFEYSSDNGLAAGERIEPDGSRVGAYQYKDPSGQLVSLKYRAGRQGFQILEGSHLPKSPEPVAPPAQSSYYTSAYEQQRRQYELQQQHDQQRAEPAQWQRQEGSAEGARPQLASWAPDGRDDGQYRDNDIDEQSRGGPHSFGEGYAFAFKG